MDTPDLPIADRVSENEVTHCTLQGDELQCTSLVSGLFSVSGEHDELGRGESTSSRMVTQRFRVRGIDIGPSSFMLDRTRGLLVLNPPRGSVRPHTRAPELGAAAEQLLRSLGGSA